MLWPGIKRIFGENYPGFFAKKLLTFAFSGAILTKRSAKQDLFFYQVNNFCEVSKKVVDIEFRFCYTSKAVAMAADVP